MVSGVMAFFLFLFVFFLQVKIIGPKSFFSFKFKLPVKQH